MTHLSDTELVLASSKGDRNAFECLVSRHESGLRALMVSRVRNDLVEDLVQETLLRALIQLPDLENPDRFQEWLIAIGANLVRMSYRTRQRRLTVFDDYVSSSQHEIQLVGWTSDPVEDLLVSEMTSEVKSAIQSLPNKMREIVELHYIDELSYKEISHHLNIPIATIEGRLYRARRKLKEDLKMTQSTTDMFELQEKLGELEEQVEALQDRQQRMAKEENMSIGQERSAAATQICRFPSDEDEPIVWGVVGAFRTQSQNQKRHSIYSTSIDKYLGVLSNDQISSFVQMFSNPEAVAILKVLVKGPIKRSHLIEQVDLPEERLGVEIDRLTSGKLLSEENGTVAVSHHDVVVALLTLVNVAQIYYVHVTKEVNPKDLDVQGTPGVSSGRSRSRVTERSS